LTSLDVAPEPLLKLEGRINDQPVTFMVNCGATNDFVSQSLVNRLKLPITPSSRRIRLANGHDAPSLGVVTGSCSLQSSHKGFDKLTFTCPLMVTTLSCCDVILGLPWLKR
jgi:hypothetical protein